MTICSLNCILFFSNKTLLYLPHLEKHCPESAALVHAPASQFLPHIFVSWSHNAQNFQVKFSQYCHFPWGHTPPRVFWELLAAELAEGKAFPGRKHILCHDYIAPTGPFQNSLTTYIDETLKFCHFLWMYYCTPSREWNSSQRTWFHE